MSDFISFAVACWFVGRLVNYEPNIINYSFGEFYSSDWDEISDRCL